MPLTKKFLASNANSGEIDIPPPPGIPSLPWKVASELPASFYRGGGGLAQETRRLTPGLSECGTREPVTVLAW